MWRAVTSLLLGSHFGYLKESYRILKEFVADSYRDTLTNVVGVISLGFILTRDYPSFMWILPALPVADVFSACVHVIGDGVDSPLFTYHHTDIRDISNSTVLKRSKESFIGAAVAMLLCDYQLQGWLHDLVIVSLLLTAFSNETHNWAHLRKRRKEVPLLVQVLQDLGLILTAERHQRHHAFPFNSDFGTFSGITNPLTNRIFTPLHGLLRKITKA